MCLRHPQTIPPSPQLSPSPPPWKIVFQETGPWCQKGCSVQLNESIVLSLMWGTYRLHFQVCKFWKWLLRLDNSLTWCVCVSHWVVSDSATPWTAVRKAPLSMGYSRQEYWSGLPLLQGISSTQGSNPGLLHYGRFFPVWATRKASLPW